MLIVSNSFENLYDWTHFCLSTPCCHWQWRVCENQEDSCDFGQKRYYCRRRKNKRYKYEQLWNIVHAASSLSWSRAVSRIGHGRRHVAGASAEIIAVWLRFGRKHRAQHPKVSLLLSYALPRSSQKVTNALLYGFNSFHYISAAFPKLTLRHFLHTFLKAA